MDNRNDELNNFKQNINLCEFVASYGFVKDDKKSTKTTICMRDASGYKILISLSDQNHWQYFSVNDDNDNGTIIDFVTKMERCNLGQIRKILRGWNDCPDIPLYHKVKNKPEKDITQIQQYIKRFKTIEKSPYLEKRGILESVYTCSQFSDRVLQGYREGVIFPHFNINGICGYEVRSTDFTYFSEQGEKSLWLSRTNKQNDIIIFFESPIEALSYYQLYPKESYFLMVSPCGNWSPDVSGTLQKLMKKNKDKTFLSAFNNDDGGDRQHHQLETILKDVPLKRVTPNLRGHDWNDQLRLFNSVQLNE